MDGHCASHSIKKSADVPHGLPLQAVDAVDVWFCLRHVVDVAE
jgi:hypothetical protein